MPAPISVVIPTFNAADMIGPTLACLYDGVGKSLICEVIFADGGSTDDIDRIAKEVGATMIRASKGRGSQLREGVNAAKGNWFLIIHADTILSPNWVDEMRAHITRHSQAGYCSLAFDQNGFAPKLIAGLANLRARIFGLPYGDQALLISRKLYQQSGGYMDIPLMEDVALARKLRGQLKPLPIIATTRSERYIKDGWFTRARKNLGTLLMYFSGVSPEKLAKRYRR
jgi:rSAM/selenodomain-associated transferase 2